MKYVRITAAHSFVFVALATVLAPTMASSVVSASPPEGDGGGRRGTTSVGGQGGGAAFGYGPPGAQEDPTTRDSPNLIEGATKRPTDKSYGARGGGEIGPDGEPVVSGYDILDADYSTYGESDGMSVPDYHVVRKGDTLWDICLYYFGDPYLWPQIWSYNEQITNAHWIFPGDRVRLSDPNAGERVEAPDSLAYQTTERRKRLESKTYTMNRYAYVDEEEYDDAMKIIGGANPYVMMSTGDIAYLGYEDEAPPIPGERLAVYRPRMPVYDMEYKGKKKNRLKKGKRVGWVVEIVGEVYVQTIAKKSAEAKVVDSIQPIERGNKVGELKTRFARVTPTEAETTDVGLVVETVRDYDLNGEEQFVIVNLGAERGIKRGNILDVVHKGDEYTADHKLRIPYEEGHPRRVNGQLLVVQVEDKTALCVIIYSNQEVVVGDPVEIRARDGAGYEQPTEANRQRQSSSLDGSASGSASAGDGKAEGSGSFRLGN
jgi:hypothetical protein